MNTYKTISEYIQNVPKEFLPKVKEMRALTKKLIPNGKETIKYGMPTVEMNGKNCIHYAVMKGHLGFYPAPSGVRAFEAELKKKAIDFSKGCIRLPYDKPLPVSLITNIIRFRVREEGKKNI